MSGTVYRIKPTADRKFVRELERMLPPGYRVGMVEIASDGTRPARLVNQNHPNVLAPDGTLVVDESGRPISVPNTPGGSSGIHSARRRVLRAITARS